MANASATKKPNRTREEMRLTPEQARLAEDNTELLRWGAVYIRRRWPSVPPDDAESIAAEALVMAAGVYDPARGKFSTCFVVWLRQCLFRWFHFQRPAGYRHRLKGEAPPATLHARPGDDGEGLPEPIDDLPGPEEEADREDELAAILAAIDPLDAELIRGHHLGGLTLRELGDILGIPREAVRMRIYTALGRARKAAARMGIDSP